MLAPAELQARMRALLPLAEAWGVEVLSAADGTARLRLPPRPDLLRPGGTVSGPALMGLADMAMWAALLTLTGGEDRSLTSDLAIRFLRRLQPGPVVAEARLLKPRGRVLIGEILLFAEGAAEPAAHVTSSWIPIIDRS
jgi:uncharacterized protein (TIGR00369 family)